MLGFGATYIRDLTVLIVALYSMVGVPLQKFLIITPVSIVQKPEQTDINFALSRIILF